MRAAPNAVSSTADPQPHRLRLPMPVLIATFCLLLAWAFSVAEVAITDCPPLLALTARFLLAATVVLGASALYGLPFRLARRDLVVFSLLGIANQALYLGLSYLGIRSLSSGL